MWPVFAKVAVLCDILTRIPKFCFLKLWVAVKVKSCCCKISIDLHLDTICQQLQPQSNFSCFSVCSSTASCCRGVGTSCLEETQTTPLLRWTTGGKRSSASRCWGRSHWLFATHHPITAWRLMTRLHTQLHIYLSSCPDAFCTSQKRGHHEGLSTADDPIYFFFFFFGVNKIINTS